MAVSKTSKTTTAKDTTKDTAKTTVQSAVKAGESKKSGTVAKETTDEPKKPVAKKTATKAPAKKTTTTRKTTTKAAAKKTTTAKKATAKKSTVEVKADVFVQFGGQEFSEKEIMSKVLEAWEAEGKKPAAIKRAKLYVKPEDGKAYYVINEGLKTGSTGAVDL